MEWLTFGAKTTAVVATKMVANNAVPGLGAAVDFAQAAYELSQGDIVGAAISTVSGVADLYSFGFFSSLKEAMKEGAKKSTEEGAKVMAKKAGKEATKKLGHKVARQVAEGSLQGGKEAATKYAWAWAEGARKKATKKFGKRLGKEIGRGLIPESVEKVFKEGTKRAAGGILDDLQRKAISTGGNDVVKRILMEYSEDGIQRLIELGIQAMKQKPKLAFEFAKIAEEGALKEFEKHVRKIFAKDFGVAFVKGGIRSCSANDNATFRSEYEFQNKF